jgi:hypothetical protein
MNWSTPSGITRSHLGHYYKFDTRQNQVVLYALRRIPHVHLGYNSEFGTGTREYAPEGTQALDWNTLS